MASGACRVRANLSFVLVLGAVGILIIVGLVVLIVWAITRMRRGASGTSPDRSDALEVLRMRFARGEIAEAEFVQAKKVLGYNAERRRRSPSASHAGFLAALAALVLGILAGCNPGLSPSPNPTLTPVIISGIRGLVIAGPTCPVEQAGQSPCVRPVLGATILALDSARQVVGRAVSDASGAYSLRLPAGTYEIVPQAVAGLMGVAAETTVTVPDGAPVQLDLQYDTGIR